MTVRLRGHHLLCMLTYVGRGYSAAFTRNYDAIAARIGAGEAIEIVPGPDDICAPVLGAAGTHCFNESVAERDRLALRDLSEAFGPGFAVGSILRLDERRIAAFRRQFAAGTTRSACLDCEWSDLCDRVSGEDFAGARLTPPGPDAARA
ncbi:DUF1284 domain-containing protein [Fulvimarina endophytica]|uniref:DUF1284 domain-containing protein n=1 Tax=Fulvimarina endophytica TaxID=2293836 RepID=A0A371X532_9HYPH|nr:DUF1284 domain-containing protein [Fulvimarina endophytica]RFC64335.1 DUF1284 domain-containing protein [Fulvimarina endophytica]